jgi:hypothetical protein
MRVRGLFSISRAAVACGGFTATFALAFLACGPAPVVVTDADQALLVTPKLSTSAAASASAAPTTSAKPAPLLVAEPTAIELPPFSCPPAKQLDLLGQTFCINVEPQTWHDAEASCQKIGAHLATMKNTSLTNSLREKLQGPTGVDRFWIGLAEPSEGRWIWSNGAPMKFAAFRQGEPNNSGGNEDCAEWLVEDGRWNDVDCFAPRHFLCEGPTPPTGSRATGIKCNGKRFTVGKTDYCLQGPARWDVAQKACLRDGGELAMLDTEAKNSALFGSLGAKMTVKDLWIGLSDEAIEGQFRWISGDSLEIPLWRAGEPNDIGGEDCATWSAADGRWNDLSCATPQASLCEKPQPIVVR